jgi:hypothetical protein
VDFGKAGHHSLQIWGKADGSRKKLVVYHDSERRSRDQIVGEVMDGKHSFQTIKTAM